MHRQRFHNEVVRINRHTGFPKHFAVCRSIRPAQFQILTILEIVHPSTTQNALILENTSLENLDHLYVEHYNEEDSSPGDFYIWNPRLLESQRARYNIFNMYCIIIKSN